MHLIENQEGGREVWRLLPSPLSDHQIQNSIRCLKLCCEISDCRAHPADAVAVVDTIEDPNATKTREK